MNNTIDRTKLPPHANSITLNLVEPEMVTLDNGLVLYLIEAGEEEVSRIDIVIKAGSAFQSKKLVASSVGSLLSEGTQNFSSTAIANKFDYFGAYFHTDVTKDTATLTLYSLTKHLPELLNVVGDMLVEASFLQNEIHPHLERKKQEFLTNFEKVRYQAVLEFNKLVFGSESAYGQVLEIGDFQKVKRQDLVDFYQTFYTLDNTYIIVSGKTNKQVSELINKHLGNGLRRLNGKLPDINFTGVNGEKEKFVEKKDAMQSAIRVGRPIINKLHPDYNRFVLLNTILGGYFGSRLMSNLREDKGFTYGVSSFTTNYIHGATFSIATEVNARHTQTALNEIFSEMKLLRETKVSNEELDLVKNYIYGAFLRNFDGPFALAERYQSAKDFGLDFDYYLRSLDDIQKITSEELLETANKYLDPEDMIRLVVGSMN